MQKGLHKPNAFLLHLGLVLSVDILEAFSNIFPLPQDWLLLTFTTQLFALDSKPTLCSRSVECSELKFVFEFCLLTSHCPAVIHAVCIRPTDNVALIHLMFFPPFYLHAAWQVLSNRYSMKSHQIYSNTWLPLFSPCLFLMQEVWLYIVDVNGYGFCCIYWHVYFCKHE